MYVTSLCNEELPFFSDFDLSLVEQSFQEILELAALPILILDFIDHLLEIVEVDVLSLAILTLFQV